MHPFVNSFQFGFKLFALTSKQNHFLLMFFTSLFLQLTDPLLELLLHICILFLVLKLKAEKLLPSSQEILFCELHKLFILELLFLLRLHLLFYLLYLFINAIDLYQNLLQKLILWGIHLYNDLILIIYQLLLIANDIFPKALLLLYQILLGQKLFPWEEMYFFNRRTRLALVLQGFDVLDHIWEDLFILYFLLFQ